MFVSVLPLAFICVANPMGNIDNNYSRFKYCYDFETTSLEVDLSSTYFLTTPLRDTLDTSYNISFGGRVYFNDSDNDWCISFRTANVISVSNAYGVNKGNIFDNYFSSEFTFDDNPYVNIVSMDFMEDWNNIYYDFYYDDGFNNFFTLNLQSCFVKSGSSSSASFGFYNLVSLYFDKYDDDPTLIADDFDITTCIDSFNTRSGSVDMVSFNVEFDNTSFYLPIENYLYWLNNDIDYNNGYQYGYTVGNYDGYNEGFDIGYNVGFNQGSSMDSTTFTIFNGILNVAMVPVNFFLAIFNFEILGINIKSLVSALLTLSIIIIVIRLITGKKE